MSYIAIRDNNSACKPGDILGDTVKIFKARQRRFVSEVPAPGPTSREYG